jgi:hypothetical protein
MIAHYTFSSFILVGVNLRKFLHTRIPSSPVNTVITAEVTDFQKKVMLSKWSSGLYFIL